MINWIDRRLVLAIHDRQIAEHGGSGGVREENLLESALARPQQLYAYGDPPPDLADLAATLAFGLARNHAFVDGNKRTAYVSCRTFLLLNGADLIATAEQKYLNMLALAEGKLPLEEFAGWLRSHIQISPGEGVQESRPKRGRPKSKSQVKRLAAQLERHRGK